VQDAVALLDSCSLRWRLESACFVCATPVSYSLRVTALLRAGSEQGRRASAFVISAPRPDDRCGATKHSYARRQAGYGYATFPVTAVEVADPIACVSRGVDAPTIASAVERVEERVWRTCQRSGTRSSVLRTSFVREAGSATRGGTTAPVATRCYATRCSGWTYVVPSVTARPEISGRVASVSPRIWSQDRASSQSVTNSP